MSAFVNSTWKVTLDGVRSAEDHICGRPRRGDNVRMMTFGAVTASSVVVRVCEPKRCKEIETKAESNLRTVLKDNGVDIYTLGGKLRNCGGAGSCGTCVVNVVEGQFNLSPRGPREEKLLAGKPDSYRLACRCKINGPCTVETKPPM
mmetsp:Transcript_3664/g.7000  ORF Transcript_3664/g.7000 Transcript_3664/m.7000 type:complete len:147 (-) Transcript_3664:623-1063(-)